MKSYNDILNPMSDTAIVKEICLGIKQMRLRKNLSQEAVASSAGIDRTTLSRMESGRAANLLTIVQVIRALGRLDVLQVFMEQPEISPIRLLQQQAKQRKKATPRQLAHRTKERKQQ